MKHYTELTIANYPVEVIIEYSIDKITGRYNVERIIIPTYDEFMKNEDNTEEDYKKIREGLASQIYNNAYWILIEEIGIEDFR